MHTPLQPSPGCVFPSSQVSAPKAKIPSWASKERIAQAAASQFDMDADDIFQQEIHKQDEACDLADIFGANNLKPRPHLGHRRTSSGNWSTDRLTSDEERIYKTAMGLFRS